MPLGLQVLSAKERGTFTGETAVAIDATGRFEWHQPNCLLIWFDDIEHWS